jgi:predicted transcriptional regulator
VVETSKGTVLAPVDKNTQYLSDNGMTVDDFHNAVSKVNSGKVVTTNKEGDVEKVESVKVVGGKENPITITKGMKFEKGKWYKGKNGEVQQYN